MLTVGSRRIFSLPHVSPCLLLTFMSSSPDCKSIRKTASLINLKRTGDECYTHVTPVIRVSSGPC